MLDIEMFKEELRKNNILKIRLMMKNSLLYDPSFKTFNEMEKLAEEYKVNIWQDSSCEDFIKQKQSWTMDDVNYELTAIVSDFTKERIVYLKELIANVYSKDINVNKNTSNSIKINKLDYKRELVSNIIGMQIVINDARQNKSINLSKNAWQNIYLSKKAINSIKDYADKIIKCCNQLSGSEEDGSI